MDFRTVSKAHQCFLNFRQQASAWKYYRSPSCEARRDCEKHREQHHASLTQRKQNQDCPYLRKHKTFLYPKCIRQKCIFPAVPLSFSFINVCSIFLLYNTRKKDASAIFINHESNVKCFQNRLISILIFGNFFKLRIF